MCSKKNTIRRYGKKRDPCARFSDHFPHHLFSKWKFVLVPDNRDSETTKVSILGKSWHGWTDIAPRFWPRTSRCSCAYFWSTLFSQNVRFQARGRKVLHFREFPDFRKYRILSASTKSSVDLDVFWTHLFFNSTLACDGSRAPKQSKTVQIHCNVWNLNFHAALVL